jgi:hypothetical protein
VELVLGLGEGRQRVDAEEEGAGLVVVDSAFSGRVQETSDGEAPDGIGEGPEFPSLPSTEMV